MSEHTKEPWRVERRIVGQGLPHTAIAAKTLIARVYSEAYGDVDNEAANARRIVACVNACAGVSNENLQAIYEIGGFDGTHEAFIRVVSELKQLQSANAELVEALEAIRDGKDNPCFIVAEAIAKHEGSVLVGTIAHHRLDCPALNGGGCICGLAKHKQSGVKP